MDAGALGGGSDSDLRSMVFSHARELGASLVRACRADMWETHPIQSPEFWPKNTWPWVESVVVLGIPLFAPMMATTPSMVYQELYDTTNRMLDDMAYRLATYLTGLGWRAMFFPRDCYYNVDVLVANPNAAFSHVIAAYYAGMGTIGDSRNLITREFGPRLRMVSVLTDAPIAPDPLLEEDLCIHCGICLRECPVHAFTDVGGPVYEMDKVACTRYHVEIRDQHHWPCGVCASVCPVGDDLRTYRGAPIVTREGIRHVQAFGS